MAALPLCLLLAHQRHTATAELQPWIEKQKAEHVRRAVTIAERGLERIEKLWDENAPEVRSESLAAATLDKHDTIIRRNLGMNETQGGSCSLNLNVLVPGGRTIISGSDRNGTGANAHQQAGKKEF